MREITLMRMNDVVSILEYNVGKGWTEDQRRISVTYRDAELTESYEYELISVEQVIGHWKLAGFNLYSDRTF